MFQNVNGFLGEVAIFPSDDRISVRCGWRQRAYLYAGEVFWVCTLYESASYVYVIETNVIQRGFAELLPFEKAAVLAERYEKVSSQGRRNDIG